MNLPGPWLPLAFIRQRLFICLVALFNATANLFSQTPDFWVNPGTGSWFTPTNWSTGAVPTAGVNAVVDNGGTAFVDMTATVGDLTIGATTAGSTVVVSSGALLVNILNVGRDGTINGSASAEVNTGGSVINSGSISGSPAGVVLLNGGSVTNNSGGTISNPGYVGVLLLNGGTVTNSAGATITGSEAGVLNSGSAPNTIVNSGTISGANNGVEDVSGGSLTNNAGGIIQGTGGAGVSGPSSLTIVNGGQILGGSEAISLAGAGAGSITNNSGATITGLSGIVLNNNGTVTYNSGGTITGTRFAGIELDSGGSVTNSARGTITGLDEGILSVRLFSGSPVSTILNSGSISGAFGVEFGTGGSVTNNAGGTIQGTAGDAIAALTISDVAPSPLTIVNSGNISGTVNGIELEAGGSITNNSGGVIVSGPGNAAVIADGGPLTFSNAGSISGSVVLANFANLATLITGGAIAGDLNLGTNPGTTLTLDGPGSESLSRAVAGVITNNGSVIKQGSGTWVIDKSLGNYAGGTTISAGTLTDALTNALGTGPISVAGSSSVFQINSGVTVANPVSLTGGGSVSNAGTISATPAGLAVGSEGGNVTNEGTGIITNNAGSAVVFNAGGTLTNQAGGLIQSGMASAVNSLGGTTTITNSGTISGLTGISLAGGGSVTNNAGGVITGSSGLAISSTGGSTTVANSGTVNGNVTLGNFANTVQLFAGGRINGSLNLGTRSGSNLVLDGSGEQTYSQAVTGTTTNAGSLTKQGSGDWILDAAMNAPVSTKILAGGLTVNGSINSPAVTVETGGMLKGIGVVNGNLLNGGSVSPGNSPGTLTVNGNFTQGSSGIYNVEIVSPQSYSRLLITGRANLGDTLQLTLASGFRPSPGQRFVVLSAGQGISGAFRSVIDPGGPPVQAAYQNGAVEVSAGSTAKAAPVFLPSDGTPAATTALVSDYVFFNSLGSLAGRIAATSDKSIGITFDGGEFDFEGQHGQTYGFPIAGHLKLTDRVALDYEIPLQYVELPGASFLEAGAILNFPIKMLIASGTQPWSWNVTPTAAIASTGSKEITGAGALTNVVSLRWHGITMTYGNYISFFEGETLVSNDPAFPKGTSQQIMKNGLKVDIPFGKGWTLETYGIYTQFFQSAQVNSYYTIGAEVGRHIVWKLGDKPVDLGYYSVGLYSEQGNRYNSGHLQFGSGWKF